MRLLSLLVCSCALGLPAQSVLFTPASSFTGVSETYVNWNYLLYATTETAVPVGLTVGTVTEKFETLNTATSFGVRVSESGTATYKGQGGVFDGGKFGSHTVKLRFVNPKPGIAGKLRLSAQSAALQVNSYTTAYLGWNVSSVAFPTFSYAATPVAGSTRVDHPLTLGAELVLTVAISAAAVVTVGGNNAGYSGTLDIEFIPTATAATIQPYDLPCGCTLAGSDTAILQHVLTLTSAGGFASQPGALAFGADQTRIPFPSSPCFVYTTPLFSVPILFDAAGNHRLPLSLPLEFVGRASVQAFAADLTPPGDLRASNGLDVDFR